MPGILPGFNKGVVESLKNRKHNYITWAKQKQIYETPAVQAQIEKLNKLIRSFGGDPSDE